MKVRLSNMYRLQLHLNELQAGRDCWPLTYDMIVGASQHLERRLRERLHRLEWRGLDFRVDLATVLPGPRVQFVMSYRRAGWFITEMVVAEEGQRVAYKPLNLKSKFNALAKFSLCLACWV